MIIADTNLIAYLLIDGEKTAAARKVYARDPDWRVPPLWRSEFLRVLATSVRAGVLEEPEALIAWRIAKSLFRSREIEPGGENVLRTAIALNISAYDAQFAVLAEEHSVQLVTADRKLRKACGKTAVTIDSFAQE